MINAKALATRALDEDVAHDDLTTSATIPLGVHGQGAVLAKEALVVAGQPLAAAIFAEVCARYGGEVRYTERIADGGAVAEQTVIADVEGDLHCIIVGERVALNLLMKCCGIATNTRRYVDAATETGPAVVDTRKTTPGLRAVEKYAVRCGGGKNHRFALYDGVMIKDNHVAAVGSLTEAVRRARAVAHHLVRVEVEVRTLEELDEALNTPADVVLLDNMDDETLAEAVYRARERRPSVLLEASGNMTPGRIAAIRDLGLDFVSAGGLIHQAVWADLSLKVKPTPRLGL